MGPETQAYITGMFGGQKTALMLLVKLMHRTGALDGNVYIQALKDTFNDPKAKFDRQDYVYLRELARSLEQEIPRS